jgi:hypothetical protein
MRTGLALLGATLCALAGAALPTTASATADADPTPAPKRLFTIKDERIKESSGLAKSVKHPGVYWTVNDSGDTGRVFAVDTTGEVKAVVRFGAKVNDVEALGIDRDGTLYIADIGDNEENREQIEIYTIPEPETLEDESNVKYRRYDFTYPDGAHDAETLLIEPGTSQLYIVTKAVKGTGTIYAAPPAPSREGTNDLTKLAAAPAGVITDGTFRAASGTADLRRRHDRRLGRHAERGRPRSSTARPGRDCRARPRRQHRPGRQRRRQLGGLPGPGAREGGVDASEGRRDPQAGHCTREQQLGRRQEQQLPVDHCRRGPVRPDHHDRHVPAGPPRTAGPPGRERPPHRPGAPHRPPPPALVAHAKAAALPEERGGCRVEGVT